MMTTFALVWTGAPLTAALASVEGNAASAPPAAAMARKARRVLSKSCAMGGSSRETKLEAQVCGSLIWINR
jgi:hypothetical protein